MAQKVRTEECLKHFLQLKNRSLKEEIGALELFWPFKHQEACRDQDFELRRRWSNLLCMEGRKLYSKYLNQTLKSYTPPSEGILQDEILGLVTKVLLLVLFGRLPEDNLTTLTILTTREYNQRIKATKCKDKNLRQEFALAMRGYILQEWNHPYSESLLAIAKKKILISIDFVDHLISAFLITSSIQLTDSIVHTLLTGENFSDTMQKFPVNKFITREGDNGEMHIFNPKAFEGKWLFGEGPRKCPASSFSPKFVETLVSFYREYDFKLARVPHKRSLHRTIPYSLIKIPKKPFQNTFRECCGYWANLTFLGAIIQANYMKIKARNTFLKLQLTLQFPIQHPFFPDR